PRATAEKPDKLGRAVWLNGRIHAVFPRSLAESEKSPVRPRRFHKHYPRSPPRFSTKWRPGAKTCRKAGFFRKNHTWVSGARSARSAHTGYVERWEQTDGWRGGYENPTLG